MGETICTLTTCRDAQDLIDLCGACQADFDNWAQSTQPIDDAALDAWADEQEQLGLANNDSPPDFDPPYFDQWTGGKDDV